MIEVTGREKSPYSIWEKMQRRNVQFEQLSDIMAFRIVVPTREACYAALGAVHAAYPVIAGRFKDYISTPKSNGYQSLHTGVTLREPRNQKIEVQIRTAADARRSPRTASPRIGSTSSRQRRGGQEAQHFRWVQDLLEILENSTPTSSWRTPSSNSTRTRSSASRPKGQLIQLPRGATPVDFAYAVHSQVGDTCVGAKVNGRLLPLRHELQNGDQVEIMTCRGGTPSPQWERFVVTGKARARIRRYVQAQQRQQHRDNGRAALAKAFRQEGVDGSEKVLEGALKTLKQASRARPLCRASATATVGPKDVVAAAYPELRQPRARRACCPAAADPGGRAGEGRGADAPISGLVPGHGDLITPAAAIRCPATASSASSPPARASPSTPATARRWRASPRRRSGSSTSTGTPPRSPTPAASSPAPMGPPLGPHRAHQRHRRQRAGVAGDDHQCHQQAGRRVVQPAHHQPAGGLLRGAGGCRGARPAPPGHVIAGLRAATGVHQVERARG